MDWKNELSGGEQRKIAIAAMLLKKPGFVIMDETFNGMDDVVIKVAQDLIREELKDSVVIVTEHKSVANNFEGFYQNELRVEENTLFLRLF